MPNANVLEASETSSGSHTSLLSTVSQLGPRADTFYQLMLWPRITQVVRHLSTRKHAQYCQLQHINNI